MFKIILYMYKEDKNGMVFLCDYIDDIYYLILFLNFEKKGKF